jgi:hypothetical protein
MVIQRVSVNASMFAAPAEPCAGAGGRDAAERHEGLVVDRLVVDVHQAGRDALGELQPLQYVPGEDAQRQPVLAVAGERDGLVERAGAVSVPSRPRRRPRTGPRTTVWWSPVSSPSPSR